MLEISPVCATHRLSARFDEGKPLSGADPLPVTAPPSARALVTALVVGCALAPTHTGRLFSSGPRGERNVLDTASTVELMRAVHEGDVLSPASRRLLLGWMRDQRLDTKLAPALPGVPLASKTGDTSSLSHDGAHLLEPGRETVLGWCTPRSPPHPPRRRPPTARARPPVPLS